MQPSLLVPTRNLIIWETWERHLRRTFPIYPTFFGEAGIALRRSWVPRCLIPRAQPLPVLTVASIRTMPVSTAEEAGKIVTAARNDEPPQSLTTPWHGLLSSHRLRPFSCGCTSMIPTTLMTRQGPSRRNTVRRLTMGRSLTSTRHWGSSLPLLRLIVFTTEQ